MLRILYIGIIFWILFASVYYCMHIWFMFVVQCVWIKFFFLFYFNLYHNINIGLILILSICIIGYQFCPKKHFSDVYENVTERFTIQCLIGYYRDFNNFRWLSLTIFLISVVMAQDNLYVIVITFFSFNVWFLWLMRTKIIIKKKRWFLPNYLSTVGSICW